MKNTNKATPPIDSSRFPGKVQNRYLDSSILLRETGSSVTMKQAVLLIALIVGGLILWTNFLTIDEVASATGTIIHQGEAVPVEHLVGGRVQKVFVQNGSFVTMGQILLRLDPIVSQLELESIQVRKKLLEATKIRLEGLLSGEAPEYSQISDQVLKNLEIQLFENIQKGVDAEQKIIANQIEQVTLEITLQRKKEKQFKKSAALIKEELDIKKKLGKKGLTTRVALLHLEKEYNDAWSSLDQIPDTIQKLGERLVELEITRANVITGSIKSYTIELTEVNSEINAIQKKESIFGSTIDSLDIKAPVEGYVHDLRLRSPGEIVKPGDVLLTLIPTDKPLVAKVKISTRDIGHLKVGQGAVLRIATYDSRRHGVVRGEVVDISPSAFVPQDKVAPYYEGILKLNKNYIGDTADGMKLFSGMTLTADIKTGSKTLLQYLLKPIHLATQTSFRER